MSKPLPDEVAKRLLILKYQVVHSLASPPQEVIQKLYFQWSREDQRKFVNGFKERSDQLVRSMKKNNLWELMTREEREFIASVPPKIKHQQHLNAMWSLESVVVLMWALGLLQEFPPFDVQSDAELLQLIPYDDTGMFISSAMLLPMEVIERKRALAELWHWRSRTRELVEMKKTLPPNVGFASFDEIVQAAANEALKQGDLSQLVENDFLAKGKAYRDLTNEEWSEVRSITMERHRALNWLCGYASGNKWDKTPLDT